MSLYVDGFVLPIPKDKIDTYKKVAEQASKIWKEYGALEYRECLGDDLEIKDVLTFPALAKAGRMTPSSSPTLPTNPASIATK